MKRALIFVALLLLGAFIFADEANLRENRYLHESLRLSNLARIAFADGDYEASATYAEEAIRYANYSDEYVFSRLKMMEADNAVAAARERLDYAASFSAAASVPEFARAQAAYNDARTYQLAESWDNAIEASNRAIAAIAGINFTAVAASTASAAAATAATPPASIAQPGAVPGAGQAAFPAQYTVRTWETVRDCLWNIAGYPWVYNDSSRWTVLYEANRSRLQEPDNADLIEPGFVLNIPSLSGEVRQGMWTPGVVYPSF